MSLAEEGLDRKRGKGGWGLESATGGEGGGGVGYS